MMMMAMMAKTLAKRRRRRRSNELNYNNGDSVVAGLGFRWVGLVGWGVAGWLDGSAVGGCYYDPCVPVASNPTQTLEHRYLFLFRLCSSGGVEALANSGLKVAFSGIWTSGGVVGPESRPRRLPGGCWRCLTMPGRSGTATGRRRVSRRRRSANPAPLPVARQPLSLALASLAAPLCALPVALSLWPSNPVVLQDAGCWLCILANQIACWESFKKQNGNVGVSRGGFRVISHRGGGSGLGAGAGATRNGVPCMEFFHIHPRGQDPHFSCFFRGFQALSWCLSAVLVDMTYFRY